MQRRKQKKGKPSDIIFILIFLAGLSLLLYPTISNFWNSMHQSYAIGDYTQAVDDGDREKKEMLLTDARGYNQELYKLGSIYDMDEAWLARYNETLNVVGNGIMGYVEIPAINCTLPIYHGTSEAVLQVAIGHIEWTSLPVGGESTHSVISGHRGLPSAELLTHIDRLEVGDAFYIHVLDEVLKYRVDDIAVVEPEDTSRLQIAEGKDYVTLVTCTPYGINSHRLLVRGARELEGGWTEGQEIILGDEVQPVELTYVVPAVLVLLVAVIAGTVWAAEVHHQHAKQKRIERRRLRKEGGKP
ncbi:MAG: class C sortase [Ruminococcaceae bacterium]|nr:class C sortase [Oscillospiraceae bacterium]